MRWAAKQIRGCAWVLLCLAGTANAQRPTRMSGDEVQSHSEHIRQTLWHGQLESARQEFLSLPRPVRNRDDLRLLHKAMVVMALVPDGRAEAGMAAHLPARERAMLRRVGSEMTRAMETRPHDLDVVQLSALVAVMLALPDRSARLDAAVAAVPRSPLVWQWKAADAASSNDWIEATRSLEMAVAIDPQNGATWADLGAARSYLGRANEALNAWNRAAQLLPTDADIAVATGAAQLAVGNATAAIALFERLATADADARLSDALGLSLIAAGRIDDALAVLQKLTTTVPQYSPAWASLAMAFQQKGDFAQARVAIERALTLEPDDERARAVKAALPAAP